MAADMSALQNLDADVQEVHQLLNQTRRALVRDHLHGLRDDLLERKRHAIMAGYASSQAGKPQAINNGLQPPPPPPPSSNFAALSLGAMHTHDHHQAGMIDIFNGLSSNLDLSIALPPKVGTTEAEPPRAGNASDSGKSSAGHSQQGANMLQAVSAGFAVSDVPAISPYDPVWSAPQDEGHPGALTLRGGAGLASELSAYNGHQSQAYSPLRHLVHRPISADANLGHMRGTLSMTSQNPETQGSQRWPAVGGLGSKYLAGHGGRGYMHHGQPPPPPPPPAMPGPMANHHMMPGSMNGSMNGSPMHSRNVLLHMPVQQGLSGYGGPRMDSLNGGSAFPALQIPYTEGNTTPQQRTHQQFDAALTTPPHTQSCAQYGIDLSQFSAAELASATFRSLTTYSWEQSDMLIKIYVPLRGVQTDMLQATFSHIGLEVKVLGLSGRNYVFVVPTLNKPINSDGCHVAASKTKKNILITLQKLHWDTADEKQWKDLAMLGA